MGTQCEHLVYVVDDDVSIRESLSDLLADEGYHVITASNGREALEKLRRLGDNRPCLILLDLMMPVMNGPQFFVEKQRDPSLAAIPVVVISADGNLMQRASAFGAEYIPKPVRLDTVLKAIERYCHA